MERISGKTNELQVRETRSENIAKTPKAKKSKPQIPVEIVKLSGDAKSASGLKARLGKVKQTLTGKNSYSGPIDREAMMPLTGEQALDIMDWIQDLTLQPQLSFIYEKDQETAYLPRETGLRGGKLNFYEAFKGLGQGKPFNFVAAQWKRDGDWKGALKTQKFSSHKIKNFNDLRDFYAGALGSELEANSGRKMKIGEPVCRAFQTVTDGEGREKQKPIGFDQAVSLLKEGRTVTFKTMHPVKLNCTKGKDGYPKKTIDRYKLEEAPGQSFTASNLNAFIRQTRVWMGKPATAEREIPSGQKILHIWQQNYDNWCESGKGSAWTPFYLPYAETQAGKLEEIGFKQAENLLEKKQTVFFQPRLPVWNMEGYDMNEFRYLAPNLGGTEADFGSGPVKPTKINNMEELRDFYRIERDSSREPKAVRNAKEAD